VGVPVGGGGLSPALPVLVTQTKIKLSRSVEALPSMKAAWPMAHRFGPPATTIADGIAVRRVGETPFALVREFVDDIVTVSEGEIANAVLLLLEIEKTVAEGAAAVPLAALMNKKIRYRQHTADRLHIDMNLIARILKSRSGRAPVPPNVIVTDRPVTSPLHLMSPPGREYFTIGQSRVSPRRRGETGRTGAETTGADHIQRLREV
jgi:threonine dehydratase